MSNMVLIFSKVAGCWICDLLKWTSSFTSPKRPQFYENPVNYRTNSAPLSTANFKIQKPLLGVLQKQLFKETVFHYSFSLVHLVILLKDGYRCFSTVSNGLLASYFVEHLAVVASETFFESEFV